MLFEKTLSEIKSLLESNESSSEEITRSFIERSEKLNPEINVYITINAEKALDQARESDKRRNSGALLSSYDGIPVAIKDNICTMNTLTTCGSGILQNFVPPYNATVYDKICNNGFVLLGKTNMDEFAMGSTTETSFYKPTRNPFDKERVPGGSSGGSAAAVAARMAPAALGSDTGGSIRQPASFCGVVGIKPTYGRVSRYGLVAFASSLDQIGTFACNVDDAAIMLKVISGADEKDSTSINHAVDFNPDEIEGDVKGMTIGVPDEYFENIPQEIKDRVNDGIDKLESMGANIERISLTLVDYAVPAYYIIATAEASSNLARYDGIRYGYRSPNVSKLLELYRRTRSEGFGKEVKRRIILGTFSLSSGYYDAYYNRALKGRTLIIEDFKKAFEKVDAIVTPVTTSTAFRLGEKLSNPLEMYMSDILTISANLAAIPGISVPAGLDSGGLPIGIQVMGGHFREKTILNVAKALESCWDRATPKV